MTDLSIQLTEQALKYIGERNLETTITVDLKYVEGCPMQCCPSRAKVFPLITLANSQKTDAKFIEIDTTEGMQVHVSKLFLERVRDKKKLTIDVTGNWKFRKLLIKEIGENPLTAESCKADDSTPQSKPFSEYNYDQVFRS